MPTPSPSDALRGDASPSGATNPVALTLGCAGLVPFVAGAALIWLVHADVQPLVVDALAKYAALIVSFLGGIHWGLGMRQPLPSPVPFAWGVAPSLMAWVAVLMPPYAGLVVLGFALVACYLFDRRTYRGMGAGPWLTLRFRLSTVAALSCFIGAAGT